MNSLLYLLEPFLFVFFLTVEVFQLKTVFNEAAGPHTCQGGSDTVMGPVLNGTVLKLKPSDIYQTVSACFRTTAGQLIETARGNCKVNWEAPVDLQSSRASTTNITGTT